MALSNLHKNLPDHQLHLPRGFSRAVSGSVMTKNQNSLLEWQASNFSVVSTITLKDDTSGLTGGRYFYFYTKTHNYQVWFDVDSTDSVIIDAGFTGLEVDISSGDTAATIATALKVKLSTISGVSASSASEVVTVNVDSSVASELIARDGKQGASTGYKFTTVKTPTGNEYLTTDSSGNIEWIVKPTIPTVPNQLHYLSAYVAPRNSSQVNVYMTSSSSIGTGTHSGVVLNTSTGSASLPTSTLTSSVPKQNLFFMPSNVTAFKIHYSVWHTDTGTQSVDWQFFDARFDTGTGTVSLNNIASITDSVPAGEQVNNIATCSTAGSGARGLLLYVKAPTQRVYYISATVELTVT